MSMKKERKKEKGRKEGRKREKEKTLRLTICGCKCAYKLGVCMRKVKVRKMSVFFSHKGHVFPRNVMLHLVLTLRRLAIIELHTLGM